MADPTQYELDRLAAMREQTEAIQAQTAALIAAREAAQAQQEAISALAEGMSSGLSEQFVLELLRLVLVKP